MRKTKENCIVQTPSSDQKFGQPLVISSFPVRDGICHFVFDAVLSEHKNKIEATSFLKLLGLKQQA